MSVKAILYKREDGDYEPIATISVQHQELFDYNADELLKPFLERLNEIGESDEFSIEHLDIVPDVVEDYYVEAKTIANWDWQLNTVCPECTAEINLLDAPDFWKRNKSLEFAGVANMTEQECPSCRKTFKCQITNE